MFIVGCEVFADGVCELDGAAVSATADLARGEIGKPALDLVEPGGRGRREVQCKSRMPSKPALDRRGLMRAVVVHDEMHGKRGGDVLFHVLQELEKLPGAMAPVQLPDDLAGGDVERGKRVVVPWRM